MTGDVDLSGDTILCRVDGHWGIYFIEQVDSVELLSHDVVQLLLQLSELGIIVRTVRGVLGEVSRHRLELGHPVEDVTGNFQRAVLNLQERNSIGYVLADRIQAIDLSGEFVGDRKASSIVRRVYDLGTAGKAGQALLQGSVVPREVKRGDGC